MGEEKMKIEFIISFDLSSLVPKPQVFSESEKNFSLKS